MKEIIPVKIIINLNSDGTLKDGVFQYQLRIDGANSGRFHTVGIQNAIDEATAAATNGVIRKAIDLAKISEGIDG